MSRRLPIYLLIDSSGSMQGEPIQAVNVGISAMLSALRQDPFALETVHIALITFDREVKELLPLTAIDAAQINDIVLPRSGATHLGEGLEFVAKRVKEQVTTSTAEVRGDYRPMLFVMTDGSPSDLQVFREAIPKIKACHFSEIIACAAGPSAKQEYLTQFADRVVSLETMDSAGFAQFFQWVSASIAVGSKSAGIVEEDQLPPPPDELTIVL